MHSTKATLPTPPVNRLGVHKRLGGNTTMQMTQINQKGYSMPYNIMFSNKMEENVFREVATFHCVSERLG